MILNRLLEIINNKYEKKISRPNNPTPYQNMIKTFIDNITKTKELTRSEKNAFSLLIEKEKAFVINILDKYEINKNEDEIYNEIIKLNRSSFIELIESRISKKSEQNNLISEYDRSEKLKKIYMEYLFDHYNEKLEKISGEKTPISNFENIITQEFDLSAQKSFILSLYSKKDPIVIGAWEFYLNNKNKEEFLNTLWARIKLLTKNPTLSPDPKNYQDLLNSSYSKLAGMKLNFCIEYTLFFSFFRIVFSLYCVLILM